MTRWPRISIVTPSYNQARYIGWTVRSVLLQRYPALEYILMDGGSTDGTDEVLRPYRPRFAHYESAKDAGQSDALHRGFARSTGEIMGYVNSDDMLAPGALESVARYFDEHPDVDAVYSHRLTVDADNRVIWYWILPRHSDYLMSRWDMIPQETCFWRRRLYERAGPIDPTFRFAMDYDLFARGMRVGRFKRLDRFLGAFRQHAEAKTSQMLATVGAQEIRRIWQDHGFKPRFWSRIVSDRFCNDIHVRGWRFARDRRVLPGCLPGIGYDYGAVWAGLLDERRPVDAMTPALVHAAEPSATRPQPVVA